VDENGIGMAGDKTRKCMNTIIMRGGAAHIWARSWVVKGVRHGVSSNKKMALTGFFEGRETGYVPFLISLQ
jgi:hypothetical protein